MATGPSTELPLSHADCSQSAGRMTSCAPDHGVLCKYVRKKVSKQASK